MDSDKREILKPIGWDDSWVKQENFEKVKRVHESNLVTNLIVLTLLSIFSKSSEVFSFLEHLLPAYMTSPDLFKFYKSCDKVKNTRREMSKNSKQKAALAEFLSK